MGPRRAIGQSLRRTFRVGGRSSRSEFWWLLALSVIVLVLLAQAENALGSDRHEEISVVNISRVWFDATGMPVRSAWTLGPVFAVALLLMMVPLTTAAWHRMQDTGRPGLMSLLPIGGVAAALVLLLAGPFVGSRGLFFPLLAILTILICSVFTTVMLIQRSQPGPNQYGPNPTEVPK